MTDFESSVKMFKQQRGGDVVYNEDTYPYKKLNLNGPISP